MRSLLNSSYHRATFVVETTRRLNHFPFFFLLQSGNVLEVACNGCRASCQGCAVEESLGVPTCIQAMQHSTSSGGGTTLETVSINPGFWRATSTSKDLLACYRDEACLGGVTGSPDYCANSYEGPCER